MKISRENSAYISKSIQRVSLLTLSRPHNYKKLSALGTKLDNLETQQKITIDVSKDMCETTLAKNESNDNSSSHTHFIEYLACVN
jgi:hypothetical protein